tara:strand:+ start:4334 stop:4777 length:444 start_codon:yes stop_codon:yes gene_type:complete
MTGLNVAEVSNQEESHEDAMSFAFPEIDPGLVPYGSRVLVQIRTPMSTTAGGLIIPEEARETEKWNTQVAKVIALGPVAFKNRETLKSWPEGDWCQEGTFIRIPKYGGDKYELPVPGSQDPALFALVNDLDLLGAFTGDPLKVKAFI